MTDPIELLEEDRALNVLIGSRRLTVLNGDLTTIKADALICPVNQNLAFDHGVANVISQAAGPEFQTEAPTFPEPFGKVVVLPGGQLAAKYVFLTVLLGEHSLEKIRISVRQAIHRTISYAEFLRLKSIAFPVLGCPKASPPYDFIAQEMLEHVLLYLRRRTTKISAIFVSAYNPEAFDAFKKHVRDIAAA